MPTTPGYRILAACLLVATGIAVLRLTVAHPPEMGDIFGEDEFDWNSGLAIAAVHVAVALVAAVPWHSRLGRAGLLMAAGWAATGLLLWGPYAIGSIFSAIGWRLVISVLMAGAYLAAVLAAAAGFRRETAASGDHARDGAGAS